MFTTWLLEQEYRKDDVGKLAHLVYQDLNNGCAMGIKSYVGWYVHFAKHHKHNSLILLNLLDKAQDEHIKSLTPE